MRKLPRSQYNNIRLCSWKVNEAPVGISCFRKSLNALSRDLKGTLMKPMSVAVTWGCVSARRHSAIPGDMSDPHDWGRGTPGMEGVPQNPLKCTAQPHNNTMSGPKCQWCWGSARGSRWFPRRACAQGPHRAVPWFSVPEHARLGGPVEASSKITVKVASGTLPRIMDTGDNHHCSLSPNCTVLPLNLDF